MEYRTERNASGRPQDSEFKPMTANEASEMRANPKGWNSKKAQAELRAVYEEKFPRLVSALAGVEAEGLSYPQIVDISAHDYSAARIKLLIIGQQTQSWYSDDASHNGEWSSIKKHSPGDAVGKLLDCYAKFKLGEGKMQTPFWRYSYNFYRALNPTGPTHGFIWSNLVKMDGVNKKGKRGYPGWPIEECLIQFFDVVGSEVELAKPDVTVFFTGHGYDKCIERSFPGAQFERVPHSGLDGKWLSVVKHDRLPQCSYRTYHPGYLNRMRKGDSALEKTIELTIHKLLGRSG